MKLLPFESFKDPYSLKIICPKCQWEHSARFDMATVARTAYCEGIHLDGCPDEDIRTMSDQKQPHLHRVCLRCRYEWLEEISELSEANSAAQEESIRAAFHETLIEADVDAVYTKMLYGRFQKALAAKRTA